MKVTDKTLMGRKTITTVLFVVVFTGISLSIHLIGIDLPWRGHLDSIGTFNVYAADAALKYGIIHTKLAYVNSAGPHEPDELDLRLTHPSFIVVWLIPFRAILGTGEWTARLAAVFLSIGLIIVTYLLSRLIMDVWGARMALIIASLLPMEAYWGRLPSEELAAAFLVTISVYFYVLRAKREKALFSALFFIFHFFAAMANWVSYLLPVALIIVEFISGRKSYRLAFTALVLNFVYFALFLLQAYFIGGTAALAKLLGKGEVQSFFGIGDVSGALFSIGVQVVLCFTIPLCILAGMYIYLLFRRPCREMGGRDASDRFNFAVPAIFLFTFIFFNGAFLNYINRCIVSLHMLTPFFVLSAGILVSKKVARNRRFFISWIILIIIVVQLVFFLDRRFSQQNGYPVDYAVSTGISSSTNISDRILTHMWVLHYYYQYYCDRDILFRIDTIEKFESAMDAGAPTTYVALDIDSFMASEPLVAKDRELFARENSMRIEPELLSYLMEKFPSHRESYFIIFDLR